MGKIPATEVNQSFRKEMRLRNGFQNSTTALLYIPFQLIWIAASNGYPNKFFGQFSYFAVGFIT